MWSKHEHSQGKTLTTPLQPTLGGAAIRWLGVGRQDMEKKKALNALISANLSRWQKYERDHCQDIDKVSLGVCPPQ